MRLWLITISICISTQGVCQALNSRDSIDIYISKLNWNSFEITSNHFSQLLLRADAKRIIKIKDSTKLKKLLGNLEDSTKTVAIHIVLTKLLDPMLDPSKKGFSYKYYYSKDGRMEKTVFVYNDLNWARNSGKWSIQKDEINKVIKYWSRRIQ
jgi:hypothetical protein